MVLPSHSIWALPSRSLRRHSGCSAPSCHAGRCRVRIGRRDAVALLNPYREGYGFGLGVAMRVQDGLAAVPGSIVRLHRLGLHPSFRAPRATRSRKVSRVTDREARVGRLAFMARVGARYRIASHQRLYHCEAPNRRLKPPFPTATSLPFHPPFRGRVPMPVSTH